MTKQILENINIAAFDAMPTPAEIHARLPISDKAAKTVAQGRTVLRKENEAQSKSVTIMSDKEIPYSLLRKVMYTAARANYSDVSFAVSQKAGKA